MSGEELPSLPENISEEFLEMGSDLFVLHFEQSKINEELKNTSFRDKEKMSELFLKLGQIHQKIGAINIRYSEAVLQYSEYMAPYILRSMCNDHN